MDYTISLLTSKPDCQALIDISTSERAILDHKRVGYELQRSTAATTSVSIEADLASVTAEIAAYQTVVDSLPDGPVREENNNKLIKCQYKKFLLEQRKVNYGVLSVLQKEFDIACLEKNIAEIDAFVVLLQDKLDTL